MRQCALAVSAIVAAALISACGGAPIEDGVAQSGLLMVRAGIEGDTLLLVDPTNGPARAVDHPSHLLGEPVIQRGIGGPDGAYALVITAQDAYVFHVATGTVQNSVPLGDLLGISPSLDPEAALFVRDDQLTVVDLRTGGVTDLGASDPGLSRLDVDVGTRRAVVGHGSGGGDLVDLEAGTRQGVDGEMFLIGNALGPDGQRVSASRRKGSTPTARQLVVFDFADPEAAAVWYEAATPEAQLAGHSWVDDVIVAVDLSGRVLVLDGTGAEEIGRLGDGDLVASHVYDGRDASTVLVSQSTADGERWHRIDPSNGGIDPLPDLDGLEPLGGARLPGALIIGEGDGTVGWSRVVVVPTETGDAVEIVTLDAPQPLIVSAVGPELVMITRVDPGPRTFTLVDVRAGSIVAEGTSAGAVVLSPDLTQVAVTPDRDPLTVVIREIVDGAVAHEIAEGEAIDWLPVAG